MRNRFFVIILLTLVLSAFAINFIYSEFFRIQRLQLIDERINESVELILKSEKIKAAFLQKDSKITENTISEVLKGKRIGRGFVLRDKDSKIVYESFNVALLNTDIDTASEWVTAETSAEYIRFRNIKTPELKNYTLQVGLILDRNFLSWDIINYKLVLYVVLVTTSLFIVSALLTVILLSPIRLLSRFLKETSSTLSSARDILPIPSTLIDYSKGFWSKSDELSELLTSLQKLLLKINSNHYLVRSWTAQMAHELKTPLSILKALIESKKNSGIISAQFSDSTTQEINQMSQIVSRFLEWAEIENAIVHKDLYSNDILITFQNVANRLEKIHPNRIRINCNKNFSVFASPVYLEQVIINLLTNSLKYSEKSKPVEVIIDKTLFKIIDYGSGLPIDVIERIGTPFNVGHSENNVKTGHGLGLALVTTVTKFYNWKFLINSRTTGTEIRIEFPENSLC